MNWTIVSARQEFSPSAIRLHLQDKQNKVLNKSRAAATGPHGGTLQATRKIHKEVSK